jgi:hypothetical protein
MRTVHVIPANPHIPGCATVRSPQSCRSEPGRDPDARHTATSRIRIFLLPSRFPQSAFTHAVYVRIHVLPFSHPVREWRHAVVAQGKSRSICRPSPKWHVILTSLWLRPGAVHPCPASPLATCTALRADQHIYWMALSSLLKARPCSISNDCFQGPGKHRTRQGTCAS